MRIAAVIIFLSGCMSALNAQSLFDKKYYHPMYSMELIREDAAGNIYGAGIDDNLRIAVLKLDTAGNIIWNKIAAMTGKRHFVHDMLFSHSGDLLIAATYDDGPFTAYSESVILCFDTTGNLIFSKAFGNNTNEYLDLHNIIPDSTGYLLNIAYSSASINGERLIRLDTAFNILSEKEIPNSTWEILYKLPGGNYFMYQMYFSTFFSLNQTLTTNMYRGNMYFDYADLYIYGVTAASDQDIFVFGGLVNPNAGFIGHVNGNLLMDWIRIYDFNTALYHETRIIDMHQLPDSSWMFVGNVKDQMGSQNYFLIHADSAFDIHKTTYINKENYWTGYYISRPFSLSGSSLIFSGSDYDQASHTATCAEIFRTDSSFGGLCSSIDTSISDTIVYGPDVNSSGSIVLGTPVTSNSLITMPFFDILPFYGACDDTTVSVHLSNKYVAAAWITPNPVTSRFTVSGLQAPEAGIEIYECTGKRVFAAVMKENASVSCDFLAPGIYLIHVTTSDGTGILKMVKQ